MNFSKLKAGVSLFILLSIFSCTKEEMNLDNLSETIYLRHRQADMPAYVHGNASEKVFLIYLHGGPSGIGLEARINTMITEVEKNNAVVYFDQRGSGNAQGNYSEDDLSIDAMADDVLALVKVLQARYGEDAKFFLMGASWGGTLGPATLLKEQEAFLGWINLAGAHSPKDLYKEYPIVLQEKANEQIALGNSVPHWEGALELIQSVGSSYSDEDFSKLNGKAHESEVILAKDMVINEPQYLDEDGAAQSFAVRNNLETIIILTQKRGLFRDVSFTDRLPEITIPSLILWGKHDLVVPTRFAQEAFDHLGTDHKELFIFERTGHSPLESEPDLFAEKVIEFINEYR
ncbi:MAG: alpha/beta hydrolase [Saprospiraceae bacterium]|nr:alpha/beta hydrolase [Saprospiraceae bacterium]